MTGKQVGLNKLFLSHYATPCHPKYFSSYATKPIDDKIINDKRSTFAENESHIRQYSQFTTIILRRLSMVDAIFRIFCAPFILFLLFFLASLFKCLGEYTIVVVNRVYPRTFFRLLIGRVSHHEKSDLFINKCHN